MVGLAVLGLAFVLFVVVAFFAAKTWHVGHVVALVFLFLSTLLLLFLSATLLKTYDEFRPKYQESVAAIKKAEQRFRVLQHGDSAAPAGPESLIGAQGLARSEQLERGRVWRNLRRGPGPENAIVLDTTRWRNDGCTIVGQEPEDDVVPEPAPDDEFSGDDTEEDAAADSATDDASADEPAIATNPHGMTANQFVYAFKEFPIAQFLSPTEKEHYFSAVSEGEEINFADRDTRGTCRIPLAYLGKFRVVDAAEQTVSIVPEGRLDPAQQKMIGDAVPWVLYEQLPLDSHDLFAGIPVEKLRTLISIARFNQFGIPLAPSNYEAMIREYVRDGQPADEQSDPPARMELTVEFVKEHEVSVDLQVEGDLPPADRPFHVDGRAQVKNLMQTEPTKFTPGQTATFDYATGLRLVQQGIAKRVSGAMYMRQLRDFEYTLEDYQLRADRLRDEIAVAQSDFDELRRSTDRVRGQIDKYEAEEGLLAQDLQGFRGEQQLLQVYTGILKGRLDWLKQNINQLYSSGL